MIEFVNKEVQNRYDDLLDRQDQLQGELNDIDQDIRYLEQTEERE